MGDEDNFFKATGALPNGVLGAFEVIGNPASISCGVNAMGGTVGVYGECFLPGSPNNPGDRKPPTLVGVCGRSDFTGIVGEGAFLGGAFGGLSSKPNPVPASIGCAADGTLSGMVVGVKTQPVIGIDIQAQIVGVLIGHQSEHSPTPPPFDGIDIDASQTGISIGETVAPITGLDIQASGVGVSIGQPTLSSQKFTMPSVGVSAEAEQTAFKGHSYKAEALNARSEDDRGGVFESGKKAQLRLLPLSNLKPLPVGEIGDLFVSTNPDTLTFPKNDTKLFLCVGKTAEIGGKSLWAELVLGPIHQGG